MRDTVPIVAQIYNGSIVISVAIQASNDILVQPSDLT